MGERGGLPWAIENIRPGDRGSESTVISNVGSGTGYLRIWISGIEGTDRGGDGAALAKYMRFSLVSDGLTTTMALPAPIDRFPASPTDRGQLVIGPIAPGSSTSLRWTWEFTDTGDDQNDAQGDGLSFSISYMLTDAPPPAAAYKYVAVDLFGWQNVVETDSAGVAQHDVDAVDPLGIHHLKILAGTRMIDEEGTVPARIVLSVAGHDGGAAGPAGAVAVSPAYVLQGFLADGSEANLTFSAPVIVMIGVNASIVPAGYLPMGVHALNGDRWTRLPSAGLEISRWSAAGAIQRSGVLTVFAAPVMGDSGALHVTDMVVRPDTRKNGWPVAISTTIGRSIEVTAQIICGGNSSGIWTVELAIDGVVGSSALLVMEPGEPSTVVLTASGIGDGEHTVTLLDRSMVFSAGTYVDWALIIISNITVFSSLQIVMQRHLVRHPHSSGGEAPQKDEVPLGTTSERPEAADLQIVESIGEVWEARRTAEQVVERRLRERP